MKLIFIFILLFSLNFSGALQQPVKNKTPFIIGGRETTIEQFPHQMALITRNKYSCGASIISSRHGLTAGECHSLKSLIFIKDQLIFFYLSTLFRWASEYPSIKRWFNSLVEWFFIRRQQIRTTSLLGIKWIGF